MTAGFPSYEPYAKSLASTLAAAGMPAEIVGCGLCGLTAVEMARGLDAQQLRDNFGRGGVGLRRLLADERPFDLVLIMAGTNDLGVPQTSAKEVLACLESMHKACWAVGTPTLALSIPESLVTGNPMQYAEAAQKWHAINKGLAAWGQVAQGENPCNRPFFVNTAEMVAFDMAARHQGLGDPDNLHFTAAGSREFGTKLAPRIASHLSAEGRPAPVAAKARTTSVPAGHRQVTPERKTSAGVVTVEWHKQGSKESTSTSPSKISAGECAKARAKSQDATGYRQVTPERKTSAAVVTVEWHRQGSKESTSTRASSDATESAAGEPPVADAAEPAVPRVRRVSFSETPQGPTNTGAAEASQVGILKASRIAVQATGVLRMPCDPTVTYKHRQGGVGLCRAVTVH
jgi:lysophospholipase L1-like esterase